MIDLFPFLIGALVGAALPCWLLLQAARKKSLLHKKHEEERREWEQKWFQESLQKQAFRTTLEGMEKSFKALAAESLQANNQAFLDLAATRFAHSQSEAKQELASRQKAIEELVKPIQKSLLEVDRRFEEMEKTRATSAAMLREQIHNLQGMQERLTRETIRLSTSLRSTTVRGRWGEVQLKRCVELAGMVAYCDFQEQVTLEEGEKRLRPDLLVRLPSERTIIIDAKAPLDAFLQAQEEEEEEKRAPLFVKHADQIRNHIRSLSRREYAAQFKDAAEFIVLFLPGEAFYSAALRADPTLLEVGAETGVILATPTTLIALLRTIYLGWKQEAISENARQVAQLGQELQLRLKSFIQHWAKVGKGLKSALTAYNDAVGSYTHRLLPKAKEFERFLPAQSQEATPPSPITLLPREDGTQE